MVSRPLHSFLHLFVSAHQSNRDSVVVPASAAARQCLAILWQWGLVTSYTPGRPGPDGATAAQRHHHITVRFYPWPVSPAAALQRSGLLRGRSPHLPGAQPHRLELPHRPGRRSHHYRSHRWLRERLGPTTLYLLASSRGVISSEEALRHRLGGTLLLLVHL